MGSAIGGIVSLTYGKVEGCYNEGNVIGKEQIGGIAGQLAAGGVIQKSKNSGRIEGLNYVGGITGAAFGNIEESYNEGEVIGTGQCIGGICGYVGKEAISTIQNTYNKGKIIAEGNSANYVGGICGYVGSNATSVNVKNNYNVGQIEIKGTGATYVGGAIGNITITSAIKADKNYYQLGVVTQAGSYTSGTSKTETEMKADAFVNTMNEGLTEAAWEKANRRNNGYPVLIGME